LISLDTNILVYAADSSAGDHHLAAREIVRAASDAGAALTEQSLLEFLNASTRKAKLSARDAVTVVRKLLDTFSLLVPQRTIVEDVLALMDRHKVGIWDARILAVCAAHGCEYLLSEDMQDGASYGGVTVLNPFRSGNHPILERLLHA
jgi:predicted nucleic acid-binding protein